MQLVFRGGNESQPKTRRLRNGSASVRVPWLVPLKNPAASRRAGLTTLPQVVCAALIIVARGPKAPGFFMVSRRAKSAGPFEIGLMWPEHVDAKESQMQAGREIDTPDPQAG